MSPHQGGAALIEFAIVSVPLLLCGLILPEAAQWHITRQITHLALVEAGRAGATEHARPAAMQAAFEQALLPLHAGLNAAERLKTAFAHIERLTGLPPWRIEIMQPDQNVFRDFADPGLHIPIAPDHPTLRNDFQVEQHARHRAIWRDGVGPLSGKNIFEANVLHLRLVYLHKPIFPVVRALLKKLGNARGDYAHQALAQGGVLPITLEIEMDMQSHAVAWSDASLSARQSVSGGAPAGGTVILPSERVVDASWSDLQPFTVKPAPGKPEGLTPTLPPTGALPESPLDAACGVALCCTNDG